MPFTYNDQYRALNVGAHRRPAPWMGTPGLVWHLGFWKPSSIADTKWYECIDYFLFQVFMYLSNYHHMSCGQANELLTPNSDGERLYIFRHSFLIPKNAENWDAETHDFEIIPNEQRLVRYDVFSARSCFHGIWVHTRAELHSEYWTLSFFCDFDRANWDLIKEHHKLSYIHQLFNEIGEFLEARFARHWHTEIPVNDNAESSLRKRIRSTMVLGLSDLLKEDILIKCKKSYPKEFIFTNLGEIFAEFYGNIFGIHTRHVSDEDDDTPLIKFSRPGNKEVKKTVPAQISRHLYDRRTALHVIDALWPILRGLHSEKDLDSRHGKPEYTISLFQGRRSLYITSLGYSGQDLPRVGPEPMPEEPVIYTIAVAHPSRWQLGRLIDRINQLGTLRLAAVRDLKQITMASDEIHKLEKAKAGGENTRIMAEKLTNAGSLVTGGLMYRIERSRYYVQEYKEQMRQLRVSRLEGFQPYTDFVQRRLFKTFDFIDRVGRRYTEVRSDIEFLLDKQRNDMLAKRQSDTNKLLESAEFIISVRLCIT